MVWIAQNLTMALTNRVGGTRYMHNSSIFSKAQENPLIHPMAFIHRDFYVPRLSCWKGHDEHNDAYLKASLAHQRRVDEKLNRELKLYCLIPEPVLWMRTYLLRFIMMFCTSESFIMEDYNHQWRLVPTGLCYVYKGQIKWIEVGTTLIVYIRGNVYMY